MSKKITNAKNVDNFLMRKYLRWGIIVLYLITIILAVLSLIIDFNFVYAALISFILAAMLKSKRDSLQIEISDELRKLKEEKKKKKKSKKTAKKAKKQ